MNALTETLENRTQRDPLFGREDDMIRNSAGGWVYPVTDSTRLDRFLILGTEGGTYYTSQKKLTVDNARSVRRSIIADGPGTVDRIVEISSGGLAPKNDQALFALAMCVKFGDAGTQNKALAELPKVARIGTHILMFTRFVHTMGGLNNAAKRAVGNWYRKVNTDYQIVKYMKRGGWTHRDVLRLTHPRPATPAQDELFGWTVNTDLPAPAGSSIIDCWQKLRKCSSDKEAASLVADNQGITHEMIPSEVRGPAVWETLFDQGMPIGALIRNLPSLTRHGLLRPMTDRTARTAETLRDPHRLRRGRIHPMSLLVASFVYRNGSSVRGSTIWEPTPEIVAALDEGFHAAFPDSSDINSRLYLGVDVSASMDYESLMGVPTFTPAMAAAGMAVCLTRKAERSVCYGFSTDDDGFAHRKSVMKPFPISKTTSVSAAAKAAENMTFGGTDCAAPMLHAAREEIPVDCFVILTDNETWAGGTHPSVALVDYRRKMGIPSRLVVVAFTSSGFTIADPEDSGMLDVVGFDSSVPGLVEQFAGSGGVGRTDGRSA